MQVVHPQAPQQDHPHGIGALLRSLVAGHSRFGASKEEILDALLAARHELQSTKAELASACAAHDAFAYSVSHDLRAPLRAIEGFAGILEHDHGSQLDAEAYRLLGIIRENVHLMSEQLDGLASLSRLSRREPERAVIDMVALTTAVVEELRSRQPERAVTVSLGPLAPAYGDADMVRQVLTDLLANAWKFTARREAATIEIGSCSEEASNVYSVRDNGAGFDGSHADRLFVVFKRLHGRDEFEGLGLGLAAVQIIVQRHGGRVWAEGSVGGGAAFHFTLPAPEEG